MWRKLCTKKKSSWGKPNCSWNMYSFEKLASLLIDDPQYQNNHCHCKNCKAENQVDDPIHAQLECRLGEIADHTGNTADSSNQCGEEVVRLDSAQENAKNTADNDQKRHADEAVDGQVRIAQSRLQIGSDTGNVLGEP